MSIKANLKSNLIKTGGLVGTMWFVHLFDYILVVYSLKKNGIIPRTIASIDGILWAPFLHGDFNHLISNSMALVPLTFVMFLFYKRTTFWAMLIIVISGGLLLWCFGREANHIGASGLIYGQVSFLMASGWFRRNFKAISIALIIGFIYGGLIWGVFPTQPGVSWEGHLFGAVGGVLAAMGLKDHD